MITFQQVAETQKEIEGIVPYINEITDIKTFYTKKNEMETEMIKTIHTLIGKYYGGKIKAKIKYGNGNIEISKSGIGNTPIYYQKINLYSKLISSNQEGLINQIIKEKKYYEAVKEHLNDYGKEVIDAVKTAYTKYPIKEPEEMIIAHKITLTPEEMKIFRVKKSEAFIKIVDDNSDNATIFVSRKQRGNPDDYTYGLADDTSEDTEVIFKLESWGDDNNRRPDEILLKNLFIYNHRADFEKTMELYNEKAKEEYDKWVSFKDEFKTLTAKFTLLLMI